MKNKKILVIGGAGFIGSALCKTLLNLNNYVICIDDEPYIYVKQHQINNYKQILDICSMNYVD